MFGAVKTDEEALGRKRKGGGDLDDGGIQSLKKTRPFPSLSTTEVDSDTKMIESLNDIDFD